MVANTAAKYGTARGEARNAGAPRTPLNANAVTYTSNSPQMRPPTRPPATTAPRYFLLLTTTPYRPGSVMPAMPLTNAAEPATVFVALSRVTSSTASRTPSMA
jgi:hypothetical protein